MNTPPLLCAAAWTRGARPRVTDCHNLRPVAGSGATVLEVATLPRVLASADCRPLATDGPFLLVSRGCDLLCIDTASANPQPELICTLPSEPSCALTGTDVCLVMTGRGPFRLDRASDGRLVPAGLMPPFPAVTISAEECGTFQTTVSACPVADVGSACVRAYLDLAADAAAAGAMIQPVMARCRLLDARGNLLHLYPETLVSLPGGSQLLAPFVFTAADGADSVRALAVSVRAWRLRVDVAESLPAPWCDIASRLEVEVSPQFHPLDPVGFARVDAVSQSEIRVSLPGRERGLSSSLPASSVALVRRCAARFGRVALTAAVIRHPFRTPFSHTFTPPSRGSVEKEIAFFADALAETLTVIPADTALMAVPNSFTASALASDNGAVLWANVRPVRFSGHSPACFAAATGGRRWTGRLKTEFADGACTVARVEGSDNPLRLSPLLSHPSPDAVRMTLSVLADGDTVPRGLSVPLTPDASGSSSLYVSPALKPLDLEEGIDEIDDGDACANPSPRSGLVAVCPADAPWSLRSVCRVSSGLKCLLPARPDRYWQNLARPAFYAFGADGIRLVSISPDLKTISSALIDAHPVHTPMCVADIGDAVAVLSRGHLFRLSRTSLTLLAPDTGADRVAWLPDDREIVTASADDSEARHFPLGLDGHASYTTDLTPAPDGWLSTPRGAYAVTADGLLDLGCRFRSDNTLVRWQASFTPALGLRTLPASVTWMIKASRVRGTLSALREWLNPNCPAPAVISRYTLDGEVRSPLRQPLSGHPLIDLRLAASLTVSPDFSLTLPLTNCLSTM